MFTGMRDSVLQTVRSPLRAWALSLAGSLVLSGCAMFDRPYPVPEPSADPFDFRVIQSDDYGSLWDPSAAQRTLDDTAAYAQRTNTFVVLFIHGWHHSAREDDDNLRDSKKTLKALYALLATDKRAQLRQALTGNPDFKLIGIYVGWRGQSLPMPLDYLTAWGRKAAAERVGEGDVSEFIQRLQGLYSRTNTFDPDAPEDQVCKPFTGLVTIGHSFGAQVLWKAMSRNLEAPLIARSKNFSKVLAPEAAPASPPLATSAIDTFGDLNILLNPALEAYQFARVDTLYRQLKYPRQQTPQVVVFSAENDWARKSVFTLERAATLPFRPRFRSDGDGYQGTLWGHALGEADEQLTHTLTLAPDVPDSLTENDYTRPETFRDFDFTDNTVFGNIRMARVPPAPQARTAVDFSPIAVVKTRDKIIDGHNGIFLQPFIDFLASYVAYIEGKRILLRRDALAVRANGKDRAPSSAPCGPSTRPVVLAAPQ